MSETISPVRTIGVPMPLVDGPEKVSGKALYTADFIGQGALVGRILRSPVAHGADRSHRHRSGRGATGGSMRWLPARTARTPTACCRSR